MGLAGVLVAAVVAQAGAAQHPALAVGAGTDFPLTLGAYVRSEPVGRLQLGMAVGLLPRGYADLITGALVDFDAFDERTGTVVSDTLTNALVWRAHLGLRPSPSSGFYFTGGYTFIGLGGNLTAAEAIYALTGSAPSSPAARDLTVNARASVHQLGLELGWRWPVGSAAIEAAFGGAYTFAAKTDLSVDAEPAVAVAAEPALLAAEHYLDDQIRTYVHSGYLSLRVYFGVL